jgi:tRNA A-37 threonylcarbamoyl transferase component Bud32
MKREEVDYSKDLQKFPETYEFLEKRKIKGIEKLPSRWRQQNLLLKVQCQDAAYVFKEIACEEEYVEISRMQALKQEHHSLFPDLFVSERNSYLMEFLQGPTFFELTTKQKIDYMQKAGAKLSKDYVKKGDIKTIDLRDPVANNLHSRFRKANKIILDMELPKTDLEIFREVPDQQCHGDLNAANLIYGNSIKFIDPSEEEFGDVARDIGRYCASCFFNHYDYFGNNKKESLGIADAFLSNFDDLTLQRVKYHIGESFLSFIKYHTETTPKSVLSKLASNLLQKEGKIISLLEKSL